LIFTDIIDGKKWYLCALYTYVELSQLNTLVLLVYSNKKNKKKSGGVRGMIPSLFFGSTGV
jgi:hypothetical protein